jgi:hypothetical protein
MKNSSGHVIWSGEWVNDEMKVEGWNEYYDWIVGLEKKNI